MTQRGTLLGGRYELDQIIGRGGMAEVWGARDRRLERDVAVKRLRIDLASDPTFQARFRREAQSAAGLNHPNIVSVYDTGEEIDTISQVSVPYIVMELVEGVTLRDVLRDGRKILPERALEFTAGVLDALDYSHRAGIIHRDIKPANVMLTPAGAVKVMDFGIARAIADTSATMTQTAAVIGTAQYLSPEQARGEKVDQRSDLYSVGCLLYELLVSQPPFTGDSPVSVAYQHVREAPVPPSHLDPEVSADMDAVTLKALAKSADDRYQDAREMRADVLRAMKHEPVHAVILAPGANEATAVMGNDQTSTARRAAVPAAVAGGPVTSVAAAPAVDVEVEEEDEKKSRKPLVILIVLAALLLAGMVFVIFQVLNPPAPPVEMATVPRVTTFTEGAAVNLLLDNKLTPKIEKEPGTLEDKGTVVRQTPDGAESVPVGSTVTIVVSQGPDTRAIPEILGKTEDEAKALLKQEGFTNVKTTPDDPRTEKKDAAAGSVTGSDPQPGAKWLPSDPVTLTIATGLSLVPELYGATEAEAKDMVQKAGFSELLTVNFIETDEQKPGLVFGQSPTRGTPLERIDGKIRVDIAVPLPVVTEAPPTPDPTPTVPEETPATVPPETTPTPTATPTEEKTEG